MEFLNGLGVAAGVIALLMAIGFTIPLVWGVWMLRKRWREAIHAGRHWPRATATITSLGEQDLGELGSLSLSHYEFKVGEETFRGIDYENTAPDPQVGGTLEVMFDPAKPSTNHPAGKLGRRIGLWAFMFSGVLLALTATVAGLYYTSFSVLFGSAHNLTQGPTIVLLEKTYVDHHVENGRRVNDYSIKTKEFYCDEEPSTCDKLLELVESRALSLPSSPEVADEATVWSSSGQYKGVEVNLRWYEGQSRPEGAGITPEQWAALEEVEAKASKK